MSELAERMRGLMDIARGPDPTLCAEHMSGVTRQVEGLRSEARFGDLSIAIDEPVGFGGTGLAPNPAEVVLAALGASLEVTLRCYADYLGIPIEAVSVELDGALDNRGFFGADPAVRAGFVEAGARIRIESQASDADLERLIDQVERCCPVLDMLRRPTPVSLAHIRAGRPPAAAPADGAAEPG